MNPPAFSVARATRTAIEADLQIAGLRSAGLRPLGVATASHRPLAGADFPYTHELPISEVSAARVFLRAVILRAARTEFLDRDGDGPTAVEISARSAKSAVLSPSPPAAGGEGRGEEGRFPWFLPSPRPSPHTCLAGRGSQPARAHSLVSKAVETAHPQPGQGLRQRFHSLPSAV